MKVELCSQTNKTAISEIMCSLKFIEAEISADRKTHINAAWESLQQSQNILKAGLQEIEKLTCAALLCYDCG